MRLLFAVLVMAACSCRAEELQAGRWEGSVRIPERELTLIVDLAQQSHGNWSGSFIIPGLGIKGAQLVDIVVRDSKVSFASKSVSGRGLDASFKATLEGNGTLTGDFVQGGNSAPFTLKKTGPPQVEPVSRSTLIAPAFEGEWKGRYELLGYPREVTIKLTNHPKAGATAAFLIIGKRTNDLPVDLIEQEGNLITIESHATGIDYEGRLNQQTNEINGTLVQGPIELPLVLHRSK